VDYFKLKNTHIGMNSLKMEKLDEIFKDNIIATIDELTQTLAGMLPKTEFDQLFYKGINKSLNDHKDDLNIIRRELIRLNEVIAYTNQLSQGLEGF
jgi:hypothetical protein